MPSLDAIARRMDALRLERATRTKEALGEARELCAGELVEVEQECRDSRERVRVGCADRERRTREAVREQYAEPLREVARERRDAQRAERVATPTARRRGWTWRAAWEDESEFLEGQAQAELYGLPDWFARDGRRMYAEWRRRPEGQRRPTHFRELIDQRLHEEGFDASGATTAGGGGLGGRTATGGHFEARGNLAVELDDLREARGRRMVRERERQERAEWEEESARARRILRSRWPDVDQAQAQIADALEVLRHDPQVTTSSRRRPVVRCAACGLAGEVLRSPRGYVFRHGAGLERLCRGARAAAEPSDYDDADAVPF